MMVFNEAVMQPFRGWVHAEAHKWRGVPGMAVDDFVQVGWIGLWEATTLYDSTRGAFAPFAYRVMKRRMVDAARGAMRDKHQVLNGAASWDHISPLAAPDERDDAERGPLAEYLWQLASPVERRVLTALWAGHGITEGAQALGISRKSFDNALQRLRRKARRPERQVS